MSTDYSLTIDASLTPCPAVFGLMWATGIERPQPTRDVPPFLSPTLAAVVEAGLAAVPGDVRQRVRAMLRHDTYKPSGRGKPASEFLLQAAAQGSFPLVNGPVDVNNAISVASGLPGSIFDLSRCGSHLLARRGHPGESYVFNPSGQTINLQDLLLVCRQTDHGWTPCGNPVKDAMETKVSMETTGILAVLYVPQDEERAAAATWCRRYAELLSEHCHAEHAGWGMIPAL